MNCLYFALRQIFPELKDNLLRNVNGKNKIKSNEVSNFLKNTYIFCNPEILIYIPCHGAPYDTPTLLASISGTLPSNTLRSVYYFHAICSDY